jgi:Iron-containing redox enzyme
MCLEKCMMQVKEKKEQTVHGVRQKHIDRAVNDLLASLPDLEKLSADDRRGIIARYTAVLEGNFIYWMTAAYLSVRSQEAHTVIERNLREEVGDNHPGMLRKFAMAAHAIPTDLDVLAVHPNLRRVRMFVAGLSGLQIMLMMAFFEAFITRFMPYLGELATRQGSDEQEYTTVHGVIDVVHTQELLRAFDAELAGTAHPLPETRLNEGIEILRTLIENIIHPVSKESTR